MSTVTTRSRPARAAAGRSSAENAGDSADPINTDKDKVRRARKRATDRQSQRAHRERQRVYIRQLEETVQSYKDVFSGGGSSDVAALLKEQERLQTRCKDLEATLARIKSLADTVHFSNNGCSDVEPDNSCARQSQQTHVSTSQSPPIEPDGSGSTDGSQNYGDHCPLSLSHVDQSAPDDDANAMDVSAQLLPHESGCFDTPFDCEATFEATTSTGRPADSSREPMGHGDLAMTVVNEEDQAREPSASVDLDRCIASIVNETVTDLELAPNSIAMSDPILTVPATQNVQTAFSEDYQPLHLCLPKLCQGMGSWDKILLSMIEETRLQHCRGQFGTSEPSLRNLLSDKSTDVLAYRLFHLISSYGSIPLHLLLSIFWVQYLFLRWYVLGTEADFLRVPEFLRPTDLERRIQHRPCIAMLVWPDLRRALIRDSHTTDPERIGIEVLQYMSTKWSPTAHGTGDLIGSTDVFAMIEAQAERMESWKVDRRFQEKYLQFAGCRLE